MQPRKYPGLPGHWMRFQSFGVEWTRFGAFQAVKTYLMTAWHVFLLSVRQLYIQHT